MSGTVALKMKILPTGLDIDLKEIEKHALHAMESFKAKNISFLQEPIAFGLKAIVISCAWPEETSVDEIENKLNAIKGVSSSEVIDYRRAFG